MPGTLIIVEDENDKWTFEAIIRSVKVEGHLTVIDTPEIDYTMITDENTIKPTALINGLKSLRNDFSKLTYNKVAIIRDMDQSNDVERLNIINIALKEAYPEEEVKLSESNRFQSFFFLQNSTEKKINILFACYFVGLTENGVKKGEIEDILKAIKTKPSPVADCVDKNLPICLKLKPEKLKDKDLVKLWVNNYVRYDTLEKKDRSAKLTKWENVMKDRLELFDFNNTEIADFKELKAFLVSCK